ncbi:MAG: M48 family metalloprotease [Firmicutes bacterium]|nr:M48 family metalloprotease [Bacillota bacterium]
MDSINTRMTAGFTPGIKGNVRTPEKTETQAAPGDSFIQSSKMDVISKPVIKESTGQKEMFGLMGALDPALAGAVSAGAEGSPVFKSLAGSLAKYLISTEDEIKLGQMMTKQVESEMSVSHDPALNARVQNLGAKIAANASRQDVPFTFKVIDDETINAFACPGGAIYVHKGLLERFPDDKHLAFIIGHEVGHVEHRDSIDALGVNFVLQIIQTALGKIPGKLDDLLAGAAGKIYSSQLSQKAEFKADQRGADHMSKLGINPKFGAEALRGLESGNNGAKPSVLDKLIASHPPTEERARRIDEYAAGWR